VRRSDFNKEQIIAILKEGDAANTLSSNRSHSHRSRSFLRACDASIRPSTAGWPPILRARITAYDFLRPCRVCPHIHHQFIAFNNDHPLYSDSTRDVTYI